MFIVCKLVAEAWQKINSSGPRPCPNVSDVVFVEAVNRIVAQAGVIACVVQISTNLFLS